MYKRLLLASDCSRESLVALREGALIAKALGASAHLLIVDREGAAVRMAQGLSGFPCPEQGAELLALGLDRLGRLGVAAEGEVVRGDPLAIIADRVRRKSIDLVVLGHRRQSIVERWWSGPKGGYLVDDVGCSLLIARDAISDEEFDRAMTAEAPAA